MGIVGSLLLVVVRISNGCQFLENISIKIWSFDEVNLEKLAHFVDCLFMLVAILFIFQ